MLFCMNAGEKRLMNLNEKVNKVLLLLNNKYFKYVVHVHTDGNHDRSNVDHENKLINNKPHKYPVFL